MIKSSLTRRLTLLILSAGLIPLYAATYYYYTQAEDAIYEAGRVRLEGILLARVNEIEMLIGSAASDLKVVSTNPVFLMERTQKANGINWLEEEHKVLKALRERLSEKLDEACIIDASGREVSRIIFDNLAHPHELTHDESQTPFFAPSFEMEQGQVYQGRPHISRDTLRWVIPFTTPIVNKDGEKKAILHFEINLAYIKKTLSRVPNMGNGFTCLIDADRHLIASTTGGSAGDMPPLADESEIEGKVMPTLAKDAGGMGSLIERAVGGEHVLTPMHIQKDSIHYLAMAYPLTVSSHTADRWFMIVALPEKDIFANLKPLNYLGFAAIASLVLGFAALYMGRRISRPVTDLYHASMKIATGELDVEVPEYNSTDELGAFNAAFRAMMGGIRALVSNLEQSSRELMDAKASAERRNQELTVKSLELITHRQELERQNKVLSEITGVVSELILFAAERQSFEIRYPNLNPVRCWEIMEGCDPSCPVYGSEFFTCQFHGGGPCCRNMETSAPPTVRQCLECTTFKMAHPDELSVIGENFNIMMNILNIKSQELDEAKKQLIQSEKMSSIGQLAAGVAHEINNPIGFISSNMTTLSEYTEDIRTLITLFDTMKNEAKAGSIESIRENLMALDHFWKNRDIDFILEDLDKVVQESLEGARRVARIVKNLKEFSHVDEAEWKTANINDGIESTLSIIWNELKYKATVIKEYGDLPLVECYPMQLNQVFMNLLVNAGQAIEEKGEIRIRTYLEGGHACVKISDTGKGIDQQNLNKIFNPFFTTKPVGKGTGLGLSITYGIVEQHKGKISVESRVGVGTTFTVKIPVSKAKDNNAI